MGDKISASGLLYQSVAKELKNISQKERREKKKDRKEKKLTKLDIPLLLSYLRIQQDISSTAS